MSSRAQKIQAEIVVRRPSTLGEGSLWDEKNQRLYWVDILEQRVFVFDPETSEQREFFVGQDVGTVVLTSDDQLLLALRGGIARLNPNTEELGPFYDPRSSEQEGRFNDGKCDPQGRFWVGTFSEGLGAEGKAVLYRMEAWGVASEQLRGVTCSNGICWSADSRTMYYIDSPTYRLEAFDFEPQRGSLMTRRVVFEFDPQSEGVPDGMCIDEEGQLWVALFDGGRVLRIDPRSGECTLEVEVPGGGNVTSCAFGGPRLDQLYITTARIGLSEQQKAELPDAGSLFVARVPVRGTASHRFFSPI